MSAGPRPRLQRFMISDIPLGRRLLIVRKREQARSGVWSTPPFPKGGRPRLVDFPLEKIIIAGPRVDVGPANLAAETAGLLGEMPLPCRGVR